MQRMCMCFTLPNYMCITHFCVQYDSVILYAITKRNYKLYRTTFVEFSW